MAKQFARNKNDRIKLHGSVEKKHALAIYNAKFSLPFEFTLLLFT